jgi:protein SCO1
VRSTTNSATAARVLSEHRNEIVIGNDATDEWQRDSVFSDIGRIAMTVRGLDPKWRDQVRPPAQNASANAGLAMSSQPGQVLFKKMCAPCHTIGVGDRVGPDLRGVTTRREKPWLAAFIRNPGQMRAQQDPVALALAAQFPAVRMPALGLAENDAAADLISYLATETSRLSDTEGPAASAAPEHQHHHH